MNLLPFIVVLIVINQFYLGAISVSPISIKRQTLLKRIKEKMKPDDQDTLGLGHQCPEMCICLEKGVTRCMFLRLKKVPQVLPQNTERL